MSPAAQAMEPFPFRRLPVELKIMIIRLAIPSVIVPTEGHPDVCYVLRDGKELRRVRESCEEIRLILDQIRYLVSYSRGREFFRFDPLRDTLMTTKELNFPDFVAPPTAPAPELQSIQQAGIPIRHIFCHFPRPPLSRGAPVLQSVTVQPENEVQTYSQIPFEYSLPIWSRLPMLKSFTLAFDTSERSWHIEGFQQYGPNIIGWRPPNNLWGIARGDPWEDYDRLNNVDSLRLRCDTGIPWSFAADVDNLSDVRDLSGRAAWQDPPRIGFHGYSRGNISQGGKWPGFKYWTETNKIEFRPLSWSEVQPGLEHYQKLTRSHPDFLARLWINRSGAPLDPEQSQYGWVEVKPAVVGDAPWVEQVATTWKMVRDMLLKHNEDLNLEWRSETQLGMESSSLL